MFRVSPSLRRLSDSAPRASESRLDIAQPPASLLQPTGCGGCCGMGSGSDLPGPWPGRWARFYGRRNIWKLDPLHNFRDFGISRDIPGIFFQKNLSQGYLIIIPNSIFLVWDIPGISQIGKHRNGIYLYYTMIIFMLFESHFKSYFGN